MAQEGRCDHPLGSPSLSHAGPLHGSCAQASGVAAAHTCLRSVCNQVLDILTPTRKKLTSLEAERVGFCPRFMLVLLKPLERPWCCGVLSCVPCDLKRRLTWLSGQCTVEACVDVVGVTAHCLCVVNQEQPRRNKDCPPGQGSLGVSLGDGC